MVGPEVGLNLFPLFCDVKALSLRRYTVNCTPFSGRWIRCRIRQMLELQSVTYGFSLSEL